MQRMSVVALLSTAVLPCQPLLSQVVKQIDAMTRKDEYPQETLVWDANGNVLKQRTVPAFEAKPGAAVLYHVR